MVSDKDKISNIVRLLISRFFDRKSNDVGSITALKVIINFDKQINDDQFHQLIYNMLGFIREWKLNNFGESVNYHDNMKNILDNWTNSPYDEQIINTLNNAFLSMN